MIPWKTHNSILKKWDCKENKKLFVSLFLFTIALFPPPLN